MANSHGTLNDSDLEARLRVNPAVKLLDFYEQILGAKKDPMNQLSMERTLETSAKLGAVIEFKSKLLE